MNGPTSPHKFQTSIPSVGTVRAWLAGWLRTRAEQVAICSPELPCTSTGPGPAGSTTCKLASDWSSWPAGGGVREVSPDWWRAGVPPSNELVTRGVMINVSIGDDIRTFLSKLCSFHIFEEELIKFYMILFDKIWTSQTLTIKISVKFVPKGPINNNPALFQVMSWCWPGDRPLSEPMMVSLVMHICVTWPEWVNSMLLNHQQVYY